MRETIDIAVIGELDLATAVQLIEVTRRALGRRPDVVRFDLAQVGFIDLAGVRTVSCCRRIVLAAHAEFVVEQMSLQVQKLYELIGLSPVYKRTTGRRLSGPVRRLEVALGSF